jgi:hypothetical protein
LKRKHRSNSTVMLIFYCYLVVFMDHAVGVATDRVLWCK